MIVEMEQPLTSGIVLPPGAVMPDYFGGGTNNLTQSIMRHFGAANQDEPGLRPDLLPPALLEGVQTIILLIVDGLGYLQLREQMAAGNVPQLAAAVERGNLAAITTTAPSMTACALTTLHTGATPAQHGMLGWNLYVPEGDHVFDMLKYAPADRSKLELPILPTLFTAVPTVYERLRAVGVSVSMVNNYIFQGTGFSGVLYAGVEDHYITYAYASDLCVNLRRAVEQAQGPTMITSYWPAFDTVSHGYGSRSAQAAAEIAAFDFQLGRELLAVVRRPDTLLILTADHGQIDLSKEHTIKINGAAWLDLLHTQPAGDRRTLYLHAKEGCRDELISELRQCYGAFSTILSREQFIASGLLGGTPSPAHIGRVGDVVVLMHDNWELRFDYNDEQRKTNFVGMHGGLSPSEMYSTCLAVRL